MLVDLKKIKSTKKDLRNFGIVFGTFFFIVTLLALRKHSNAFFIYAVIAAAFLSLGLLAPQILKPIHKAVMAFSIIMGTVMSYIILTLLFIFVLTPLAFLFRINGKKFIALEVNKKQKSYWMPRVSETQRQSYEKQY